MSNGMGREFTYLSSHATNHYFIPNWGNYSKKKGFMALQILSVDSPHKNC